MADRPILFSSPMILALLAGTKTQTRRLMKPQPGAGAKDPYSWGEGPKPGYVVFRGQLGKPMNPWPYAPGDRLWVRETWRPISLGDTAWDLDVTYAADGDRRRIHDGQFGERDWSWPKAADTGNVSPLFMPRWASRLTLTVTEVRVQRLQEISEADAVAEGVIFNADQPDDGRQRHCIPMGGGEVIGGWTARDCYADLWKTLHGPSSWDANPWVVAVSFDVRKGNIDG